MVQPQTCIVSNHPRTTPSSSYAGPQEKAQSHYQSCFLELCFLQFIVSATSNLLSDSQEKKKKAYNKKKWSCLQKDFSERNKSCFSITVINRNAWKLSMDEGQNKMESRKLTDLEISSSRSLPTSLQGKIWGFLCAGQWTSAVASMTSHFLECRTKV